MRRIIGYEDIEGRQLFCLSINCTVLRKPNPRYFYPNKPLRIVFFLANVQNQ